MGQFHFIMLVKGADTVRVNPRPYPWVLYRTQRTVSILGVEKVHVFLWRIHTNVNTVSRLFKLCL